MADDDMEEEASPQQAAAAAQAAGARFGGSADEMAEASPASPAERVAAAHLLFLAGLANPADENASSSADERLGGETSGSDHDSDVPTGQRATKTQRKQSPSLWDVIVGEVSREAAMTSVETTTKTEFGVGDARWKPHTWKPKPPHFNTKGLRRQVQRCPFGGTANANCGAQLRRTECKDGLWTVERNRIPHADHTVSNKKRGLSKFMKLAVTSPSKTGLSGHMVVKRMRTEHGAFTATERSKMQGLIKREKLKYRSAVVPKGMQGTFGGLKVWADHHTRDNLTKVGGFGIHTTFVCGIPEIDSEAQRVNMAYSTENLLLNAYRQSQHGMPSIVHIDCTHRLVLEGHACMLFGTVDTAQHFHAVG